jgi:hypothetical protein
VGFLLWAIPFGKIQFSTAALDAMDVASISEWHVRSGQKSYQSPIAATAQSARNEFSNLAKPAGRACYNRELRRKSGLWDDCFFL